MVAMEIPPDQVLFATGGYDHTIRFWAAYNGQCQRTVQHPDSQVNAMELTPDRRLLAVAGFQHIRTYDIPGSVNNTNPIACYEGVAKNINAVGFFEHVTPSSMLMFTGGEDGSIRIWDLRMKHNNHQVARLQPSNCSINTVALHPNQNQLISGDANGSLHIWDWRMTSRDKQGKEKHVFDSFLVDVDTSIQHLSIEGQGTSLACVDNKGRCCVFQLMGREPSNPTSLATLKERPLKFVAHSKYVLKCKFSPDSTLLATTSADHTAKIWRTADLLPLNVAAGEELSTPTPLSCGSTPVVATASDNLKPQMVLKNTNQRWVWDVAFSNDSQYVLTGSSDTVARLWNINSGENIREYSGHQKAITAIAFSDGIAI